jgi:hypothetical protein
MTLRPTLLMSALLATPAFAGDLAVSVEVPRLEVSEYHRPYLALWIERPDSRVAGNLAVWYKIPKADGKGGGEKWLKDMRQWWRRSGRELTTPIDGVTSATRPVGKHVLNFSDGSAPLGKLPAGKYVLKVEAAREAGGRELISIPFTWPASKETRLKAAGKTELGEIHLNLKP